MNLIIFPKDGYVTIPVEGKVKIVNTKVPIDFEFVKQFVGGYVQLVPQTGMRSDSQTCCDEDGLTKQLAVNKNASEICNHSLVGNIILIFGKARFK